MRINGNTAPCWLGRTLKSNQIQRVQHAWEEVLGIWSMANSKERKEVVVAEERKEEHYEIKAMSQGQQLEGAGQLEGVYTRLDIRSASRTCGGLHRQGLVSLPLLLPPMVQE